MNEAGDGPLGEQRPHRVRDRGGLRLEPAVSYAQDAVGGELEGRVAGAVMLERGAGAVKRVPVELDDEALLGPERVDFQALDVGVGGRGWEVSLVAEVEEEAFQLGADIGGAGPRWVASRAARGLRPRRAAAGFCRGVARSP
jgi:hypothetical protein